MQPVSPAGVGRVRERNPEDCRPNRRKSCR